MNFRDIMRRVPVSDVTGEDSEGASHGDSQGMKRVLGWPQLTVMGIAAIIGTGIFVLPGQAAALHAGPAVIVSFALCGIVCAIVALCYAEFASMIRSSGSAFMYAYATLGEIIAWIIGWDLLLEYAFGASGVAVGWSAYFKSILQGLFGDGWLSHAPTWEVWGAYLGVGLLVVGSAYVGRKLRPLFTPVVGADGLPTQFNNAAVWSLRAGLLVLLGLALLKVPASGSPVLFGALAVACAATVAFWRRLLFWSGRSLVDAAPYVIGLVGVGLVGLPERFSKAPDAMPWVPLIIGGIIVLGLLYAQSWLHPMVQRARAAKAASEQPSRALKALDHVVRWAPWICMAGAISFFPSVDLPAMAITLGLSALLIRGVHHTAKASTIFVIIKVTVIIVFVAIGLGHIDPSNWSPFIPQRAWLVPEHGEAHWAFGFPGILTGAAIVLFAFIGFDGVTTAAGETKRPQRDVPIGILLSLFVCTIAYMLMAVVMTGDMHYSQLAGDETTGAAPVAMIMKHIGLGKYAWVISLGAIAGITSALILSLYGQSRVQWSMAHRGLVSPKMAELDPEYGTPANAIKVWGVIAAVVAGLFPISELSELTNIGTLAAFIIVQIGIVVLRYKEPERARSFRCPTLAAPLVVSYVRYDWLRALLAVGCGVAASLWLAPLAPGLAAWFSATTVAHWLPILGTLAVKSAAVISHMPWILGLVVGVPLFGTPHLFVKNRKEFTCGWLPDMPILGSICCLAFMLALPMLTWYRFIGWMVIGFVVYFAYGFWHSKLRKTPASK